MFLAIFALAWSSPWETARLQRPVSWGKNNWKLESLYGWDAWISNLFGRGIRWASLLQILHLSEKVVICWDCCRAFSLILSFTLTPLGRRLTSFSCLKLQVISDTPWRNLLLHVSPGGWFKSFAMAHVSAQIALMISTCFACVAKVLSNSKFLVIIIKLSQE